MPTNRELGIPRLNINLAPALPLISLLYGIVAHAPFVGHKFCNFLSKAAGPIPGSRDGASPVWPIRAAGLSEVRVEQRSEG